MLGNLNLGVSDAYMGPVVNKSLNQEKEVDNQLMHLSLVDIVGAFNQKFKLFADFDEDGNLKSTNNVIVEHIIAH